jgi:hypothetical protein
MTLTSLKFKSDDWNSEEKTTSKQNLEKKGIPLFYSNVREITISINHLYS